MPLLLPNGMPILGDGVRLLRLGTRLHNVSDEAVSYRALDDLVQFTETDDWYAAIAFSDGRILLRPALKDAPPIPPDVCEKMIEIAHIANRDLHHDGHWLVAAGDGYITAIFRDASGDVWFSQTFADTWARLRHMHRLTWVNILENCWKEARRRYRELGLKQSQIIRPAAGSLV